MENSQNDSNELSQEEQLDQVTALLDGAPTGESGEMDTTDDPETGLPDGEQVEITDDQEEEAEEQDEQQAAPEIEAETLAELAEQFGVPVEKLYDIQIPMPAGGDPITLGQFKDRVAELRQIDAQREQVRRQATKAQQVEQELQRVLQSVQGAPKEIQQAQADLIALQKQAQGVDWAKFERRDPGKAALARQKLQEAMGNAQARLQRAMQATQQATQHVRQQRLAAARDQVLQQVQEWRNPDVAVNDIREIRDVFTQTYGFNPDELMQVDDPRVVMVMRAHAKLLKQAGDADVAVKRVQQAPRHLRPVKSKRTTQGQKRQAKLNERARQSGSMEDTTAAVSNLLSSHGIR